MQNFNLITFRAHSANPKATNKTFLANNKEINHNIQTAHRYSNNSHSINLKCQILIQLNPSSKTFSIKFHKTIRNQNKSTSYSNLLLQTN